MFDENFSFLFPTSASTSTSIPFSQPVDPVSTPSPDISPFSSRCSSPVLAPLQHSHPALAVRTRDNRYNSRPPQTSTITNSSMPPTPRHPSITALASDFQAYASIDPPPSERSHSLSRSATSSPFSGMSTPATPLSALDLDLDLDVDAALIHTDDTLPLPPRSASCSGSFESSLWDLNVASISTHPTSYPTDAPLPPFALKRRQRQALGRLQCLTKKAPDLAMLVEECHPSSMPLPMAVPISGREYVGRDIQGRSKSICSVGGRIEKERMGSRSGSMSITSGIVKRVGFGRAKKRGVR